jgi:hypothetical protein
MILPPPILADGSEEIVKILIGVAFFGFWIISGIISASRKKGPQQQQKQRSWEQILEDLAGVKPKPRQPPPPPPVRPAPPPRPLMSGAPRPRPARQRKKIRPKPTPHPVWQPAPRTRTAKPQVVVKLVTAPPLPATKADISAAAIGAARAASPQLTGHTRAKGMAQLLSPATLRNQYLLTEIFQPPVALRQPR